MKWWTNYKRRLVPWLQISFKERFILETSKHEKLDPTKIEDDLKQIFQIILESYYQHCKSNQVKLHNINSKKIAEKFGFKLCRKKSNIADGGIGVFVNSGKVQSGSLVALYPGLIYTPGDPIFLPSINNQYVFRCEDGTLIDGKDCGLSKIMYRSCSKRDSFNLAYPMDITWMDKYPVNPLSIGQYINNSSSTNGPNVAYQEHIFSKKFSENLLPIIPNCYYSGKIYPFRTILLVSLRDINEGEELFSSYHTLIV